MCRGGNLCSNHNRKENRCSGVQAYVTAQNMLEIISSDDVMQCIGFTPLLRTLSNSRIRDILSLFSLCSYVLLKINP